VSLYKNTLEIQIFQRENLLTVNIKRIFSHLYYCLYLFVHEATFITSIILFFQNVFLKPLYGMHQFGHYVHEVKWQSFSISSQNMVDVVQEYQISMFLHVGARTVWSFPWIWGICIKVRIRGCFLFLLTQSTLPTFIIESSSCWHVSIMCVCKIAIFICELNMEIRKEEREAANSLTEWTHL